MIRKENMKENKKNKKSIIDQFYNRLKPNLFASYAA